MSGFESFKINKQIINALNDAGITKPTPIQEKAIPRGLGGADIMGIAQTGTGKTAAFLVPLLMKLKYTQEKGPRGLILAPTRELAVQIGEMAEAISAYMDIRILTVYGGTGMKKQIESIQQGCDLLIATPGRFLDIYRTGELNNKGIKTLVLDEADRMMDMGFMPQLRKILEVIPVKRQNLLFSATISEKVEELSHEFLDFPEKIEITPSATAVETVTQQIYKVPNLKSKINLLEYLLEKKSESIERVIIFTRKRTTAENVYKYLIRKEIVKTRVIHANKGQNSRLNAIEDFRNGEVEALVSTDVAARGIDIADVSHVINFDVPLFYEDYVHRIGRTGRALKKGIAITFCSPAEEYHIGKIEGLIRDKIPISKFPKEVEITKTPFDEMQEMNRAIDVQKKRDDPNYKGAFHEKKKLPPKQKDKRKRRRRY